jgi:hypothetical protein
VSRKRKPRKNTTKGWFSKETQHENVATSSAPAEDPVDSSVEYVAAFIATKNLEKSSSQVDPPKEEYRVLGGYSQDVLLFVCDVCYDLNGRCEP